MSIKLKIMLVAGARPNFMKIAPLYHQIKRFQDISTLIIHTGQHYDKKMSEVFFDNLDLPSPDINLGVGSGSHAKQTAEIMIRFETIVLEKNPDLIIVVGDVNSTLACSLVASKLHIKVAHVEAGLRSHNWKMPEEINRVLTDRLSDFLFTTSSEANQNLIKEGINSDKIFFVGNVMIDTLLKNLTRINESTILDKLDLIKREYSVITLHRPSNVDSHKKLASLVGILKEIHKTIPIIYPVHPRTMESFRKFGIHHTLQGCKEIKLIDPLGYIDFLKLIKSAKFVLTDSGGIQEETTILGVPCLTLRDETERPVTITHGTNKLVGTSPENIKKEIFNILEGKKPVKKIIPEKWDGKAAERIVKVILKNL